MKKITGIVLTKNEENMIADCLDSISFCSEIIVIDTDSTDNTTEIARRMGARIVTDSSKDFAKKRDLGLDKASYPYLLYVDADERVSKELRESILKIVEKDAKVDAWEVQRINYYLGKHEWPKKESFLRFFKKSSLVAWEGRLHETAKVSGIIGKLDGELHHYTHRNLSSMLKKTIEWSEVEARLRYDAKHPKMTWWRFLRVMITAFYDSYIRQKGWKVGVIGLIESMYQSFSMFVTYARLWEMQQKK